MVSFFDNLSDDDDDAYIKFLILMLNKLSLYIYIYLYIYIKLLNLSVFKSSLSIYQLIECFGAGTAAIVSPVYSIIYKNIDITFPTGK